MEPESKKWKTEVSYRAAGVSNRPLCESRDGNDPRLSTVKGLSLACAFAVALGRVALGTIALASDPKGPTEVRFEMYLGYTIVAKGSMGGLQKLNFIIDTGAVPSVVDRRVARKLGLEGTLDSVSVFSKDVRTEEVVVPTIELGPVHAESVRFLAQDLRFIEKGLGLRIDAIIGLDVLGGHDFSIDYKSKRIAFELPAGEANSSETTEPQVPFESGPGFAVVDIQIQGQVLRLMVDTGTSDLVLFAPRVQGRLPGMRPAGVKTKTTMAGVEQWPVLELAGARLGSADLATQKAVLMDGQAPASVDLDGLLGVTSLGVRRITFDFEHNTIRWEPR